MDGERKILEAILDWIVSSGTTQYGSIFVICDDADMKRYSEDLNNRYCQKWPEKRSVCISAEDFLHEVIVDGYKNGHLFDVKDRYQELDLFILTGTEQIGRKTQTQKELYIAVDKMNEKHKQVVFFSHVPPRQIIGAEDRNLAQFEGSLIIDLLKD